MPGPNNSKKKKQQKKKAAKAKRAAQAAHDDSAPPTGEQTPECTKQQTPENARQSTPKSCTRPRSESSPQLRSAQTNRPPSHEPTHLSHEPTHYPQQHTYHSQQPTSYPPQHERIPLPQQPFIYDPGNGPRVRDARAFVDSPFFAHAPAFEDPLCAEFAQGEVLEMLRMVLPEEMALILWYNKSRLTSRICPSCRRLYNLGQALPDLIEDGEDEEEGGAGANDEKPKPHPHAPPNPLLEREQMISGLCSPVCFILAAFDHPGAIKSAWGAMAEEMDEEAWEMLNAPASNGFNPLGNGGRDGGDDGGHESEGTFSLAPQSEDDHLKAALGMLVRMTRLHDLGLAQLLCMPEEGDASDEGAPARNPLAGKEAGEGLLRDTGAGPLQDTGAGPLQDTRAQPLQATEVA